VRLRQREAANENENGLLPPAIACCLLFAAQARATDYVYGYTSIYVDSGNVVRGYHRTELDYNSDLYYTPYVCGELSKDGVQVVRACQGGYHSATRNTNWPYFSGSGGHPLDWYWIATAISNMRPEQSIHLGDTNGQICSKPTGETTSFTGWADAQGYPTVANFIQTLPPSTASFSGRTVEEFDGGTEPGQDGCFFPESQVPEARPLRAAPPWSVNSNNTWGPDQIGYGPLEVQYYRNHLRAPCTVTVIQRMAISCGVSRLTYKFNTIVVHIGLDKIWMTRDGVRAERDWYMDD
jgi:hypothetical protein